MNIINALFFITLLSFTCLINSQQVFDQVKSLLSNFRNDISKEQIESDNRCAKEEKWVNGQLNKAIAILAHRTKDVNDIKARIIYLIKETKETTNDVLSRVQRIKANSALLEQFMKERCENNLLFVRNLREYIESIDVLTLLKQDIQDYYKKDVKRSTAFVEKFAEYSHLLDEEHKLILSQLTIELKNLPKIHKTQLIESKKDEKPYVPTFEEQKVLKEKLVNNVLGRIDGLINHLKNSRNTLTQAEIKAGEDFAIFQNNMSKENVYLSQKIKELSAHSIDLKTQLNIAQQMSVRREEIRKKSEDQIKYLRKIKEEKEDYCKRENARRRTEAANVGDAQNIFQNVLDKLSLRVKLRTQRNSVGEKYTQGEKYEQNVRNHEVGNEQSLEKRKKERNELAYY